MNGMDLIAQLLKKEGVEWFACFPAHPLIESAAKAGVRPIVFRQERGGINAADGFSRQMAGRGIGVFASQRGPGVENSFGGIAQAWADAVPLVFLPGGPGVDKYDIPPNFSAIKNYQHVTKLAVMANSGEHLADQFRRVFHVAKNGRPGPTLFELNHDITGLDVSDRQLDAYKKTKIFRYAPSRSDVQDAVKALLNAATPVLWAGQGVLYSGATETLKEFAELTQIPVLTTMQAKSAFPDDHPLALGSANRTAPKPVWRWLGDSDVLCAIGSGLTRTNYGIEIPDGKFLIHSTVSSEDINKDYNVDIGLIGDARLTLEAMIDEAKAILGENGRRGDTATAEQIAQVKQEWLGEWSSHLTSDEVPINPYRLVNEINKAVDHENTVLTHDAGHPRDEIMPFYKATVPYGYIGWGKTTHLGYGIGLMIGAKMADPNKFCMNFMGDAAFGMAGLDIETSVRAGVPITTLVLNNGTMGGYNRGLPIAMERYGAGNLSGDYAGVAKALGAEGIKVEKPEEIVPAIQKAQQFNKDGKSCLIEVFTTQQMHMSAYPDLLKQ